MRFIMRHTYEDRVFETDSWCTVWGPPLARQVRWRPAQWRVPGGTGVWSSPPVTLYHWLKINRTILKITSGELCIYYAIVLTVTANCAVAAQSFFLGGRWVIARLLLFSCNMVLFKGTVVIIGLLFPQHWLLLLQ